MIARILGAAALFSLALSAAGFAAPASPGTSDGDESDRPSYETLLAELKNGHTNIDYWAFRDSYARSAKYDPYGHPPAVKDMVQAMRAGDCQKVISSASSVLDADFTDIQAHIFSAQCEEKQGDASSANFHRTIAAGLIRSIAKSGDGTNPQSPLVVIAVKEEYAFLYSQGYRITMQSLVRCGTGECDAMDVVDANGAKKTFFFDVSRPFAWMTSRLAGRDKKPQ